MSSLERTLRRQLENTVKQARRVAEAGARKAIEQFAVHEAKAWSSLTEAQKRLRNRLRAHGRQLGDQRDEKRGTQTINRLVGECAYEHWHRMLFARFLAENNLLIEPETGVAITLTECQELARDKSQDWLEYASGLAVDMLPQIFRSDDPVLQVNLPVKTRSDLEDLLKALPSDIFLADDSLGWVYQFWQAEQKDAVNKSGEKIGADELPAVTQLFTEDYMVKFLLHNTLGAWWAGKVLAENPDLATNAKNEDELRAACAVGDVKWTYLRFVKVAEASSLCNQSQDGSATIWRPAAGTFEGWPRFAKDITMLDPCMGSGHFLVFALLIFVAIRMAEEGLTEKDAVLAVLRNNLFGLEIDQRCTQIAAFNLALAAWRRTGYCPLPTLNLACSGLAIGVSKSEWLELADELADLSPVPPERDLLGTEENLFSDRIKSGLETLYNLFSKAPILGSLINPRKAGSDLLEAGFDELESLLVTLFAKQKNETVAEMAVAAHGIAKAAEILAGQFTIVATNVPYLGRGKQDKVLYDYCGRVHPDAKTDLATCFVERCLDFCVLSGSMALVTPQNWLFLKSYIMLRKRLLSHSKWTALAGLGSGAFETIGGAVVNVFLLEICKINPEGNTESLVIDVGEFKTSQDKAVALCKGHFSQVSQNKQLNNPDMRITLSNSSEAPLLEKYSYAYHGLTSGDGPRMIRKFWEFPEKPTAWITQRTTVDISSIFGGASEVLFWNDEHGPINELLGARKDGQGAWGKRGIVVKQMTDLSCSLYYGESFDNNTATIVPFKKEHLPAIWAFCSSPDFYNEVRKIDRSLSVTNATLVKVPFDLAHWQKVAAEKYPNGLPKPFSSDPTQWLFNGHSQGSDQPLQVAVARLLGYRWPRQTGSSFPDCPALGSDGLEPFADDDGIVCLHPVNREQPAATRLRTLLATAFGDVWSAGKERELLAAAGITKGSLEDWLSDGFFEQHCALFHQRPFIWHIWDGRQDGFNALLNYHRLSAPNGEGHRLLEKMIYTYLGDWITRQRQDQQQGVEGADARLAAALHLQNELKKILEGEPPYDIFVRWKPLHEQAIGWEPDINDGVRMNIRPFMVARPLNAKAKNACILRITPKIKWDKDRGKEPERPKENFPWFWGWDEKTQDFPGNKTFDGNRWNDLHYKNESKQSARERKEHNP